MFQIRSEQLEKFEIKQSEDFINRMILHLQTHFPDETENITLPQLRSFIETEIDTANRFEIYNEDDIAVCISAIFALRPNLTTDPEPKWVKEVQADPELSSDEKAELLCQWAEEELEAQNEND